METQQQLLHNHARLTLFQQLPPTADTGTVATSNQNGDNEANFKVLNCPNVAPSGAEIPGSEVIAKVEEKGNGDHGIDFSPPSAAAVKDDGPHDPESSTCMKERRTGGWITTPFIFGAEAAERLAVTGSHANLISYLVNEMHQKTLQSATIINTFSSTSAWAPLLGAFIADSYLGRFATILYASFIYLAGLILITMSAVMPSLQPPLCETSELDDDVISSSCVSSSSLQIGVVYVALSLMVVGSGGIRPCVAPFGASQFDQSDPKENAQLNSYFNWYFFSVTVAGLIAATVIVYIEDDVSWGLGFGISAVVMLLSIASFVGGSYLYRFSSPRGSPFTRMAQVLVAAVRKRHLVLPSDPNLLYYGDVPDHDAAPKGSRCSSSDDSKEELLDPNLNLRRCWKMGSNLELEMVGGGAGGLKRPRERNQEEEVERGRPRFPEYTGQFRCLDKAAIELESDRAPRYNARGEVVSNEVNPWRLCPVRHVEELKSIVRLVPMWATGVVTGLAIAQAPTYLVQQARTMDRNVGGFNIPPASMQVINTLTIVVWLPLFDRYLIPKVIAPRTGHPRGFTYLQKIGIGYALGVLAMAVSILVEHERRLTAQRHGFVEKPHEVIPFSAFSLVPQEVLGGIAGCFSFIGHYEFFYHMVPEHITSTASALSQTSYALGVLLASALLNGVQSATNSPGHPGWLDENLNKAHLDYFYTIILFLQCVNFTVYVCFISKWYRKHLMGS